MKRNLDLSSSWYTIIVWRNVHTVLKKYKSMRKSVVSVIRKWKKGSGGFWLLVFLGIVGWFIWTLNDAGLLDGSYSPFTSIEETTCKDLQEHTIGRKLSNQIGNTWEIIDIRNSKEASRTKSKLVCRGELKMNPPTENRVEMELTYEDGKMWFDYKVYDSLFWFEKTTHTSIPNIDFI